MPHPRLAPAAALAALAALPALAHADPAVRIEHAAARVLVLPEARGDVAYEVKPGRQAGLPGFQERRDGGVLVLDQGLTGRGPFGMGGVDCVGGGPRARVRIPGHGVVAVEDLPLVVLHVPRRAHVSAGDAVFGETRAAEALDLGLAGCGDWRLADVSGPLDLRLAGSGDVRGGGAGDAHVRVSGSGDVNLEGVHALEAAISGSGDVRVRHIDGPLTARISGSGDVEVRDGRASEVDARIAGSGDVRFGGTAGEVSAAVAGSGGVHVAHATGKVSRHVAGSGDVEVGR